MHFSITEGYNVRLREYENAKFEVTVGGSHRDLGIADDELSGMSDNELEVLESELKLWVREQLWGELKPWLMQTKYLAEDEENNLAAELLRSHLPRSQSASTTNKPKPARA